MDKTAVLGVVGNGRINQCVACRDRGVDDGAVCQGFGPGCFLPHASRPAAEPSAEDRVEFRPGVLKKDSP